MNILIIGHEGYVGAGLMSYFGGNNRVWGWGRRQDILKLEKSWLDHNQIDLVINCSALMEREGKVYDVASASHQINVDGATHLVRLLKGTRTRWIQISTKDVYGSVYSDENVDETPTGYRPRFLVDEQQSFSPETVYAKSKLMSEFIAESHLYASVIRLSTCYTGFSHWRGNWMVRFIRNALIGEPINVTHNGKQFRDPLHVDDLGRLIERMMARDAFPVKLNAGGGPENVISLMEFIREMDLPVRVALVSGNDYGFAFGNRLARECLGWTPEINLHQRLPAMVKAVRESLPDGKEIPL